MLCVTNVVVITIQGLKKDICIKILLNINIINVSWFN